MKKMVVTFVSEKSGQNRLRCFIKKRHKELGINTTKVAVLMAKRLNIHESKAKSLATAYGYYIRGKRPLTHEKLCIVAEILQVNIKDLIDLETSSIDEENSQRIFLDPNFSMEEVWENIPPQIKTLTDFLLWIELLQKKEEINS